MSRFSSEDYEEMFPNAGELWHANLKRAIAGKRGQRDLRTLEAALLALPAKRLIHGRLAKGDEVCAVGAFVVQKRVEKGEDREAVLAELASAVRVYCAACHHSAEDHDPECQRCASWVADGATSWAKICPAFIDSEESETDDYGDETAKVGKRAGMTETLAWRIGSLNDETFGDATPEERYVAVLAWVRAQIVDELAA